ncbi:hypothetical protein V8C42DRAFT_328732 [Trichoderma barbatum]
MAFYHSRQSADCTITRGMRWADIDVTWLDIVNNPPIAHSVSCRTKTYSSEQQLVALSPAGHRPDNEGIRVLVMLTAIVLQAVCLCAVRSGCLHCTLYWVHAHCHSRIIHGLPTSSYVVRTCNAPMRIPWLSYSQRNLTANGACPTDKICKFCAKREPLLAQGLPNRIEGGDWGTEAFQVFFLLAALHCRLRACTVHASASTCILALRP